MQSSHLEMCFHSPFVSHVSSTSLSPTIWHMVHAAKFQARVTKSCYQPFLVKNKCSPNGQISRTKSRASPASSIVDTENTPDIWQWCEQKLGFVPSEREFSTKEVESDGSPNFNGSFIYVDRKERDRRKKIGLANKGRVPWNKGRKHTAESRERIRQRTKEAMMDPKVKKKMAECRRAHSEQTKERIGTSLRRLWAEKLKWERSRAKFLSIWAENIAEAAKRGGYDQHELDWNSYDKIKEEIAIRQLRWAADRAVVKETEKLAAAQRKTEKKARLAQKREEQEQRAKAEGEKKRKPRRKSKEEREELNVAVGLKLKERLTKIHKKKISTNGQISGEDQRTWEKLDMEFIKTECRHREISLADQIQAAKTKRVAFDKEKSRTSSSLCSPSEKSAE